jgi:hypothetical protein
MNTINGSSKITPEHLDRVAFVYVRQSSYYQVEHHLESQRRQYDLHKMAVDRVLPATVRETSWSRSVS